MEEDIKVELKGGEETNLNIYLSSSDALLSSFGISIAKKIKQYFPRSVLHFQSVDENMALKQLASKEVHFCLTSLDVPHEFKSKKLSEVEFKTCLGKKHPLLKKLNKKKEIQVDELLKYDFVIPSKKILGSIKQSDSSDGWRDHIFPRKIGHKVDSVKVMEQVILEGLALGYLPDYMIKGSEFLELKVLGCKYSCKQKVKIATNSLNDYGWVKTIWDQI